MLISGGGTTLKNLLEKIAAGQLAAEIVLVISSNPKARGLADRRSRRHCDAHVSTARRSPRTKPTARRFSTPAARPAPTGS